MYYYKEEQLLYANYLTTIASYTHFPKLQSIVNVATHMTAFLAYM